MRGREMATLDTACPGARPMALEREIETYRQQLPALLAHKGKYVLIHGSDVIGCYDKFDDAMRAGYEQFASEAFLVRQISETERVLVTSRSIRPCPTSPGN